MASLFEPTPSTEPEELPDDPHPPERRLLRRWMVVTAVVVIVVLGAATASGMLYLRHLKHEVDANIERFPDPVATVPSQDRPPVVTPGAVNILVIGTDSRISVGDEAAWAESSETVNSLSLVHVEARRHHVAAISIPRDVVVDIPQHGRHRLATAFADGGPGLVLRTVEELAGTRIDHVAIIDFKGFVEVTDALDGVAVPVRSSSGQGAGLQVMSGQEALEYVRQATPGDNGVQRLARQQAWTKAVTKELLSRGTLANPMRLTSSLDALSKSVAVDAAFTIEQMQSLALSLRSLHSDDIAFLTLPVRRERAGTYGNKRVVRLDTDVAGSLWKALRADTLAQWTAREGAALDKD